MQGARKRFTSGWGLLFWLLLMGLPACRQSPTQTAIAVQPTIESSVTVTKMPAIPSPRIHYDQN